ncbi:hypothetical protein [Streptomyces sp. NBC_00239]|uniref:hypothetical protein n=1 Tax=Streptomyces sp. NBC_00239 TaxID=2903640 RepID=UPI002E28FB74|nr:hypothetical protein [Streptomyces sp. NBC_00239]
MSSTQLTDRPAAYSEQGPGSGTSRSARRRARSRKRGLLARYVGYVGYFVGAGLISGAVVHHPLDPARYTLIAIYGVLVFLGATVLNEFILARQRPTLPRALAIMGASLLLSFGIGMLSGGLQHFEDFPTRAAVLIPAGMVLSFIAYVLKDEDTSWRRIFGLAGLAVLVTALISFAGLRQVAANLAEQPGSGGHGHSSGAEEPEEEHQPKATDPAAGAPTPKATRSQSAEPGHTDGHSGH